jgi:hypothetical protein
MAASTTTQVTCPMHQGMCGETVAATGLTDFSATTVRVAACSSLKAQGWGKAPQLVLRKSQADRLVPAPAGGLRHRDGLVVFA